MFNRAKILGVICVIGACVPAIAQTSSFVKSGDKPAYVIPDLYNSPNNPSGQAGLFVAPSYNNDGTPTTPPHQGHFNADFQQAFSPFNASIATQLTLLPIPSPASGFIYHEDPTTGLVTRSAQSFGPVLTERAETIGRHKFFLGFAYQYFNFSTLDGLDLGSFPVLFRHAPDANNVRAKDVITANNSVDMTFNQTIAFLTFGLTDRVDVSVALPMVNTSITATSGADIQRIGTAGSNFVHTFVQQQNVPQATFRNSGSATGIGDVIFRLKGTLVSTKRMAAALAVDLRAPTGDAKSFLGSGAGGVRPFLILSVPGVVSPHVNVGYQINGSSILTGSDILAGKKGHVPNNFFYAFGTDVGVIPKKLSLAFDILGQRLFNTSQVESTFYDTNTQQFVSGAGSGTSGGIYQAIQIKPNTSVSIDNAALGFKVNPVGNLLFTANVLLKLDNGGLRQRAVPLVGLSYTF